MGPILAIGLMLIVGFFGGIVARRCKFPMITGYIIIGILMSPSILNIIPRSLIMGTPGNPGLSIITDIALGIIAYMVGGSLRTTSLRRLGKSLSCIVPFEALGAWLAVAALVTILAPFIIPLHEGLYLPMGLVIGALSCATAPAATMAIVREYKAKGPLTTTLLATVALDDAVAVIAFAIAMAISGVWVGTHLSGYQMLMGPLIDILVSILIGLGFGIVMVLVARLARTREMLLVVVLGAIMLCVGVANLLGVSSILASLAVGFMVVNKARRVDMFSVIEEVEEVVYAIFFVLAGMHFDLEVLQSAGLLAVVIVLSRCAGKFVGARAGATISHAPDTVRKYLGFALLPKAGVTVGLVLLAQRAFPVMGDIMVNAVLASVIINELVAPPLSRYAICKSGEAGLTL